MFPFHTFILTFFIKTTSNSRSGKNLLDTGFFYFHPQIAVSSLFKVHPAIQYHNFMKLIFSCDHKWGTFVLFTLNLLNFIHQIILALCMILFHNLVLIRFFFQDLKKKFDCMVNEKNVIPRSCMLIRRVQVRFQCSSTNSQTLH